MNTLAILLTLASLVGQGVKAKKTKDYSDEALKIEKANRAKSEKERRSSAISRAIGSKNQFYSKPNQYQDPLNTIGLDTFAGMTGAGAQLAGSAANLGSKTEGDLSFIEKARQKRAYRDLNAPQQFDIGMNTGNLPYSNIG